MCVLFFTYIYVCVVYFENIIFLNQISALLLLSSMITNINYRGHVLVKDSEFYKITFRSTPPYMFSYNCNDKFKLIVFRSGKCRIMGCKEPFRHTSDDVSNLPLKIQITHMMSATATFSLATSANLKKLGDFCYRSKQKYMYDPEIFPALRLSQFNPLCVNIFSSGKCVILGLKTLHFHKYVRKVKQLINASGSSSSSHDN